MNLYNELKKVKDVGMLFDMVCFKNYLAGQSQSKIPIDENRKLFELIKERIIKDCPKK